jgi:hypothetical protein
MTAVLKLEASSEDERITNVEAGIQLKWPEAIGIVAVFWVGPVLPIVLSLRDWVARGIFPAPVLAILGPWSLISVLVLAYDANRIERFIRGALLAAVSAVPAPHPYRGAPTRPA